MEPKIKEIQEGMKLYGEKFRFKNIMEDEIRYRGEYETYSIFAEIHTGIPSVVFGSFENPDKILEYADIVEVFDHKDMEGEWVTLRNKGV